MGAYAGAKDWKRINWKRVSDKYKPLVNAKGLPVTGASPDDICQVVLEIPSLQA